MNRLIKILIFYTAFINTIALIALLLLMRTINESGSQLPQEVKKLTQEIERLSSTSTSSSGKLTAEIDRIQKELEASKQEEVSKVLGMQKAVLGYIRIADSSYQTVDIYSLASFSSSVVGKLQANKNYGFLKKEGSWYLVQTADGQEGYVNSRFVKETQETP